MVDNPRTATKSALGYLGDVKVTIPIAPSAIVTAGVTVPVRPRMTGTGNRMEPSAGTACAPVDGTSGTPDATPLRGPAQGSFPVGTVF